MAAFSGIVHLFAVYFSSVGSLFHPSYLDSLQPSNMAARPIVET